MLSFQQHFPFTGDVSCSGSGQKTGAERLPRLSFRTSQQHSTFLLHRKGGSSQLGGGCQGTFSLALDLKNAQDVQNLLTYSLLKAFRQRSLEEDVTG